MNADEFKRIVLQNGPVLQACKKPKTLVEAMTSNFALANSDINWKFHSGLAFAWLMGSTVAASRLNRLDKNRRSTVPFLRRGAGWPNGITERSILMNDDSRAGYRSRRTTWNSFIRKP